MAKKTLIGRISKYEQSKILETKLIESEDQYDDEYYEQQIKNYIQNTLKPKIINTV